jgi:hypothetical protein
MNMRPQISDDFYGKEDMNVPLPFEKLSPLWQNKNLERVLL